MQRFYFLVSIAALIALWFLYDLGYRGLILAAYRNRLFQLRFELFRLAATGQMPFDSHVYRSLEILFNGLVRYAHTISYSSYRLSIEDGPNIAIDEEFQNNIRAINELPEQVSLAVWEIVHDTQNAIAVYMAATSPIFLAFAALSKMQRRLRSKSKVPKTEYVRVFQIEAYRKEKPRAAAHATARAAA